MRGKNRCTPSGRLDQGVGRYLRPMDSPPRSRVELERGVPKSVPTLICVPLRCTAFDCDGEFARAVSSWWCREITQAPDGLLIRRSSLHQVYRARASGGGLWTAKIAARRRAARLATVSRSRAGVNKIRIGLADGRFGVMYIAKFEEAIYVVHSFENSTRRRKGRKSRRLAIAP